jgi:hypothetical protein
VGRKQLPLGQIIQGDWVKVLNSLPEKSVDLLSGPLNRGLLSVKMIRQDYGG